MIVATGTPTSVTLVLGGARSGKSRFAEAMAERSARPVYLATGRAWDGEMSARIDEHRARRGGRWTTVEEPLDLAGVLPTLTAPDAVVLVDCLTLWVTNLMMAERDMAEETRRLVGCLRQPSGAGHFRVQRGRAWHRPRQCHGAGFPRPCRPSPSGDRGCGRCRLFSGRGYPHDRQANRSRKHSLSTKIPATVITGFLGAGKTSLIRHLLENARGRRLALIINEFGDLGVDREMLAGCGIATCREEDIIELANGCICCTVADDFLPTIEKLLNQPNPPDHIVIETSGSGAAEAAGQGLRLAGNPHPRHRGRRHRRDRCRGGRGRPFRRRSGSGAGGAARPTIRWIMKARWRSCSRSRSSAPTWSC